MAVRPKFRIGVAALAVGWSLAAPHAAVAEADSGSEADTSATSAGPANNPASRTTQHRTPRAAARTARPAAGRPARSQQGRPATKSVPAGAARRPAASPVENLPEPPRTVESAPVVAPQPSAAPPTQVAAAAGPAAVLAVPCESCRNPSPAAPKLSATATARLTQVADRIGHWLSGLPSTPANEWLSGALLIVRRNLLPTAPPVQARSVSSSAASAGPVLTGITSTPGSTSLVLSFNAPLIPGTATDLANYRITASRFGNPQVVTTSGPALRVVAAQYSEISSTSSEVTLTLARPMRQRVFYRIFINGELPITSGDQSSNPLVGLGGGVFDGDNDETPGGNFYGLFAVGSKLRFTDSSADRVVLTATGDSGLNVWRELNGDIDQITVLPGGSALSGSVIPGRKSTGTVYIGSITVPVPTPLVLNGATDNLPQSFVTVPSSGLAPPPPTPTATSPTPVPATGENLPYTMEITPVRAPGITNLPGIQSGVYAQTAPTRDYPSGLWLMFGGRTNGLHNFSPSGEQSFPPSFQNGVVYVVNPVDWHVWSLPWNQTNVPASVYNSLSSTNAEHYRKGDTLYVAGGYAVPGTVSFTGDVTALSKDITVTSGLENLAVGQKLSGVLPFPSGQEVFPPGTTITAINGNTVTASVITEADATGLEMAAYSSEFTTYDTLTALSIKGLVEAVINGGDVASLAKIRQTSDPAFAVTGGEMAELNGRTYLVFGHDFQGGYNGATANISQVYSDEIRSFRIIDTGRRLAIAGYRAVRDPVNYRRRDGNLVSFIGNAGQPQLAFLGGVFTPGSAFTGYQAPILIGSGGRVRIDAAYQQFFSQYTTANIPLYDPRSRSMYDILIGGISLYDYTDGQLTKKAGLPWIDEVTSLVQSRDGAFQEYSMSPILPVTPDGTGYYGASSAFFRNQALPAYRNGVLRLNRLQGPTVAGYMFGGIYSTASDTTNSFSQTGASNQVFQITLTPS